MLDTDKYTHSNIVTAQWEGKTWVLADLAKHLGISYSLLYSRHINNRPLLKEGHKPTTYVDEKGRVCTCCGEYKPWEEFYTNLYGYKQKNSRCKKCVRMKSRSK